jgi:hypothetical protein
LNEIEVSNVSPVVPESHRPSDPVEGPKPSVDWLPLFVVAAHRLNCVRALLIRQRLSLRSAQGTKGLESSLVPIKFISILVQILLARWVQPDCRCSRVKNVSKEWDRQRPPNCRSGRCLPKSHVERASKVVPYSVCVHTEHCSMSRLRGVRGTYCLPWQVSRPAAPATSGNL